MKNKRLGKVLILMIIPFIYTSNVGALEEKKEMIVVFEEGITTKQEEAIKEVGEVQETVELLNLVVMDLTNEEIENVQENEMVRYVEENQRVSVKQQKIGYGLVNTKVYEAINYGNTGEGVKIAIVDSGISSHSDLVISGGASFVDYTDSYSDDFGHGTHVAGIVGAKDNDLGILGVAPDSQIYSLKVLDNEGTGYLMDIIKAVEWSITNKMDIINLSIGIDSYSPRLEEMLNYAYANGILIVSSAGNDASAVGYPAKHNSVIAVSATNSLNKLAYFSNFGPETEVSAPGEAIYSTHLRNGYETYNGTSMAAPHVSGLLALLKGMYPDLSAPQIRQKMQESTLDLGIVGRDNKFGYGLIQAVLPQSEFNVTKRSGLYTEINGTTPIEIVEPQTFAIIEYGNDGWLKIQKGTEQYWMKNGYRFFRKYINKTSALYDEVNGIGKVGVFNPQFVKVKDEYADGWLLIDSYKGLKWTKDGYTSEKIKFENVSGLYEKPDGQNRVGLISPQTIEVLESEDNGWYRINSYKGMVWIKDGYATQRIYINQTSGLYNTATNSEKVGSFGPQYITALQIRNDGWILMQSYLGNKWAKVGVNNIQVTLTENSGIYKGIGTGKIGSLLPQRVNALVYVGNNWYKINSYKGIVYVKNGYN